MLELSFVREHPDIVESSLKRRGDFEKIAWLSDLLEKDNRWRSLKREADRLRALRNTLTERIKEEKTRKADVSKLINEAKELPTKIKSIESEMDELRRDIDYYLKRLPNILHESVPQGTNEQDNLIVREWGKIKKPEFEIKHHGMLATELGIADFERAVKISGSGFYFLKGDLALLDIALQYHAINMLLERGYTLIEPPLMMRRRPYEGVTDMADFENVMYKIQDDDLYLIATSEHPIAAMHMNEILDELPLKYVGVSPCFRREIGKHGLDERGLFRVHQFNKVEQFIFCRPKDSWDYHEELLRNAEDLLKSLEIPYRVVNVCTGDIGTVAAKKYDIEGYSPREDRYIELISCSNCTSYQAVGLNIRCREGDKTVFVHTLNSTMVATARAIRLIIEHYQQKDGSIKVPDVLAKYMSGKNRIKSAKN